MDDITHEITSTFSNLNGIDSFKGMRLKDTCREPPVSFHTRNPIKFLNRLAYKRRRLFKKDSFKLTQSRVDSYIPNPTDSETLSQFLF